MALRGVSEGLRRGMHRAVGGRASGLRGGAEVFGEGVSLCGDERRASAGNASRSLRARFGTAWACVGVAWGSGSARRGRVAVRGRAKVFGGGMGCEVGGECIAQPAGVRRHCVGERKCSGRACAVRGRAEIFSGEWVVRAAGLTHIRRSSTHVYYYIYVRPVRAVKLQPWGRKTPSASTHRPRRLSHPPRLRLHFRARVHTSPASPSAAPAEQSASRSSSYPQWVIHGKVIHIVARRPVQNVLALAPAHAYI